jgi:hypothetical protein
MKTPERKLTAKHIALLAIIDCVRADMANGADYINQHPITHDDLPPRTAAAVESNIHRVIDSLNNRLPTWARRP